MLTVYGVNASPFVRKVRVVLAEKKVAYQLEPVIPVNVSDEFRAISPLGKIPALRDGDRTLSDSSVICAYLERTHPSPALYPADAYEYARALWFEEYADTALVAEIGPKIFFALIVGPAFFGREPDKATAQKAMEETLPPLLTYLESQLAGDWLVGKGFSIADAAIGSQFVNLQHAGYGVDAARWPKLAAYVGRILGRATFKPLIEEEAAGLPKAA